MLFGTKCHVIYNFISFCSNTFFTNHPLQFKYQHGHLKVNNNQLRGCILLVLHVILHLHWWVVVLWHGAECKNNLIQIWLTLFQVTIWVNARRKLNILLFTPECCAYKVWMCKLGSHPICACLKCHVKADFLFHVYSFI